MSRPRPPAACATSNLSLLCNQGKKDRRPQPGRPAAAKTSVCPSPPERDAARTHARTPVPAREKEKGKRKERRKKKISFGAFQPNRACLPSAARRLDARRTCASELSTTKVCPWHRRSDEPDTCALRARSSCSTRRKEGLSVCCLRNVGSRRRRHPPPPSLPSLFFLAQLQETGYTASSLRGPVSLPGGGIGVFPPT